MLSIVDEKELKGMKKFVQSRWSRECRDPHSPWQSEAGTSCSNYSTPERSAFSDFQDTPAKATVLQTELAGRHRMNRGDFVLADVIGRTSWWQWNRLVAERSAVIEVVNERPDATYDQLIRDVFEREGKSQMRKCDIERSLVQRYPYFRTLRRLDSCVGLALRKSSKFKPLFRGVWRYRRSDATSDESDSLATTSAARKQRHRRRPDFYRVEWSKSSRTTSRKMRMGKSKGTSNGVKESNLESSTEPNCDSSSESDDSSTELNSNTSQKSAEGQGSIATDGEKKKVEKIKQQLKDFNEEMLKETIAKITEENKKCLRNIISSFKEAEMRRCPSAIEERREAQFSNLKDQNKQVLAEQINQIISQNEKCLEQLASSSASHFDSVTTVASSLLVQKPNPVVAEALGDAPSRSRSADNANILPPGNSTSVYASNSSIFGLALPVSKQPSVGLCYPLPVLDRYNKHGRDHVRLGKRMVPRLKSSCKPKSVKNDVSAEISSKVHAVSEEITAMGSNKNRERNSEDPFSDMPDNNVTQITKFHLKNKVTLENPPTSKESLDDEFAKFARQHDELDDIVAMIDPAMVFRYGSKQDTNGKLSSLPGCDPERKVTNGRSHLASAKAKHCPNRFGKATTFAYKKPRAILPAIASKDLTVSSTNRTCCEVNAGYKTTAMTRTLSATAEKVPKTTVNENGTGAVTVGDEKLLVRCSNIGAAAKLFSSDPCVSADASQRGFSYRYIPPYQWGIGGRSSTCSAHRDSIAAQSPMLTDAEEYLLYSATPTSNSSQAMSLVSSQDGVSQGLRASRLAPNNFQCRIQGANLHGLRMLEQRPPCCANFYIAKY